MIALACMLIGCDGSKVVLSLAVVSDVHINTGVPMTSEKWTSALNQLAAKAAENDADGLDGVLVAGDLIDYATTFRPAMAGKLRLLSNLLQPPL